MNTACKRVCQLLATVLLLAQGAAILRMPFVEDRFFCWSPHDSRNDLEITAQRDGVPVPPREIEARYGLPSVDWHSIGNVKQVIRTAESRHSDRWQVQVKYRRNLAGAQTWTYPSN